MCFSFVFETIAGALHWWMPVNNELTEVPTTTGTVKSGPFFLNFYSTANIGQSSGFFCCQEDRLEQKMEKERQQYGATQVQRADG